MIWWMNVLLGFLVGSFAASYFPAYRNLFMKVLGALASKTQKKASSTTSSQKDKSPKSKIKNSQKDKSSKSKPKKGKDGNGGKTVIINT